MYDEGDVRIVVANEEPLLRHGLKLLLQRHGCRVVGEAEDLVQAIDLAYALQPDVLLLDLAAPAGMDTTLRTMDAWCPFVRTIVLTADDIDVRDEHGGGTNVVRKDAPVAHLLQAVRPAPRGERRTAVRSRRKGSTNRFGLTRREIQIVVAVAEGESNKGIALRLSITEDTVKHHLSNIFDKAGVFSRLELALFAVHHGLIEDRRRKVRPMPRQAVVDIPERKAG
jgi:two-component system nitrate/nitrite response regulator NarL